MTSAKLLGIAATDGGLIVDGRHYTPAQLQGIAAAGKALLIIRNAKALTSAQCLGIAATGKGKVIFDFS